MLSITLLLLGDVLKYQLYDGTSCYDSSHTPDVGILLEDAALRTCSPAHCTSDDGEGGEDCHAGQRYEGCTCSPGYSAKVIASIGYGSDGLEYYEYECCNDGTGTDDDAVAVPRLLAAPPGVRIVSVALGLGCASSLPVAITLPAEARVRQSPTLLLALCKDLPGVRP